MTKRKSKNVSFRLKMEDYSKLQHKAGELDFDSVSQLLRSMIKDLINGLTKQEPEKKTVYPNNMYCKQLYRVFLNQTPEGAGGTVPKDQARDIQLKASISTSKTFRIRLEMLKAQGFIVEKGDNFIVLKKWL